MEKDKNDLLEEELNTQQVSEKEKEAAAKNDDWVKLVSIDGFSFMVQRSVVMGSGTLKRMLEGTFTEGTSSICHVNERGIIVEKMLEYLMYKKLYEKAKPHEEIPDFQKRIMPEVTLELLMAADYFEM